MKTSLNWAKSMCMSVIIKTRWSVVTVWRNCGDCVVWGFFSWQQSISLLKATAAIFPSHRERFPAARRPHTLCHLSKMWMTPLRGNHLTYSLSVTLSAWGELPQNKTPVRNTVMPSCSSIYLPVWLKYLLVSFHHKCFTDSITLPGGATVLKPCHHLLLFLETDT